MLIHFLCLAARLMSKETTKNNWFGLLQMTDTHATAVQFIIWLSGEVSKYVTRNGLIYDRQQPGSIVYLVALGNFFKQCKRIMLKSKIKESVFLKIPLVWNDKEGLLLWRGLNHKSVIASSITVSDNWLGIVFISSLQYLS